jgi:hypothetical protein
MRTVWVAPVPSAGIARATIAIADANRTPIVFFICSFSCGSVGC